MSPSLAIEATKILDVYFCSLATARPADFRRVLVHPPWTCLVGQRGPPRLPARGSPFLFLDVRGSGD